MKLRATTTPTDTTRCLRSLIAWATGDKLALDTVLHEVMADRTGVPGLLFELMEFGTDLGSKLDPDLIDHLRAALLTHELEQRPGKD